MIRTIDKPDAIFLPTETEAALRAIIEAGQVFEVRILDGVTADYRKPHNITGYFDDITKLLAALLGVVSWKGCYFTPNPVNPALLARAANRLRAAERGDSTSDNDILRRYWLLIDVDPKRPANISATDDEHDQATECGRSIFGYLRSCGWPDPHVCDSGNGWQAMYRIDEPTTDNMLVEKCLKALALMFDCDAAHVDTSVHNPARIWRLPGTLNRKGDSIDSRPHRFAKMLVCPAAPLGIVTTEQLQRLAAEFIEEKPHPAIRHNGNGTAQPFDVAGFIARNGFETDGPHDWRTTGGNGSKWIFRQSPMCDHHDEAAFIAQFPSGAIVAKCQHNSCSWSWDDLRAKYEPKPERSYQHNGVSHRDPSEYREADDEPRPDVGREHLSHDEGVVVEKSLYSILTAAELDSGDYRIEEAVEGVMVERQPLVILAAQKSFKTSLALLLAIVLATGTTLLGRFKVNRARRVLFMSGESGLGTLQDTARRQCASMGIELADITNLLISGDIPQIADAIHLGELKRVLTENEIEVLFIDPLYLALNAGGSEGSVFAMGAMLRGISNLCQSAGVTLVLLHHLRKGNGMRKGPPDLSDASWSGISEFARQWWIIDRAKPYVPGTGVHELTLNVGGSAGHSGSYGLVIDEGVGVGRRHWDVTLQDAGERIEAERAERQAEEAERKQRIVDEHVYAIRQALEEYPDGETAKCLRDSAGLNSIKFGEALNVLRRRGEVETCEVRKGSRTFEGIKKRDPHAGNGSPGQTGSNNRVKPGVPFTGE